MYVAVKLSLVYVIKPEEHVFLVGQGYGILCQAGNQSGNECNLPFHNVIVM